MCSEAWWALGRHHVNKGDVDRGFPGLLIAIGQGGGAESWAEVFLLATGQMDDAGITGVARAAFVREAEDFLDALRRKLMDLPADVRSWRLRDVEARVADLRDRGSITVRFRGDDGTEEFEFR